MWVEAEGSALAACLDGLPPLVAGILARRGLGDADAVRRFLEPREDDLMAPGSIPSLDAAVARILAARERGERVVVVGDYDVDGVSSTAILIATLTACGLAAEAMLPDRLGEGYGFQPLHAERAEAQGASLIVTVDCGTTAYEAVDAAQERGLGVIVIDHHQPGRRLPDDVVVVNPLLAGPDAPGVGLAAAGLAFKVATGIFEACGRTAPTSALLRIACLGTIADMVPLVGENRTIAALGLRELSRTRSLGLRALYALAGVRSGKPLDAEDVGFRIGPRLNAAGRLGSAQPALDLLLTRDSALASELARRLEEANAARRAEEESVVREATERFAGLGDDLPPLLVAWDPGWHRGVVGIAAGRLARSFHRPTILLGVEGETATGSGRSIPGIHLHRFLEPWRDQLERFGGHEQAIGLSASLASLGDLQSRWLEAAQTGWSADQLRRQLVYDATVEAQHVDATFARALAQLAPHGVGNPRPVVRVGPLRLFAPPRTFGTRADKPHLSAVAVPADAPGARGLRLLGWSWAAKAELLAGEFEVLADVELDRDGEAVLRLIDARPAE